MDRKIMRQKERAAKESESRLPTPPEKAQLDDLKVETLSMLITNPLIATCLFGLSLASTDTVGIVWRCSSCFEHRSRLVRVICAGLQQQEKDALAKSEERAEAGDVDSSMVYAQSAEGFAKRHADLLKQFTTPERTMSVCDVCGVFINSTDNDARKAVRPQPTGPQQVTSPREQGKLVLPEEV